MAIKPMSGSDGLHCDLIYRKSLFSGDHIDRLLGQWLCLLKGIIADPDCIVTSLPLLSDEERRQLQTWSHGPALPLPDRCAHQIFEEQAARTPEAAALVFGDRQLSYAALNARANQLAHRLIERGVGPDVIVGLCLERSFGMVIALLAIHKAGGIYLPLDPSLPEARLQRMLDDADPLLVVVDGSACALATLASRALLIPGDDLQESGSGHPQSPAAFPLSAPAYLLYTSGSTGVPKGVLVPHRVLAGLVAFHRQHERLGPPARTLQFAGCGFDVSLQEVFGTLCLGGTLFLISAEQRLDPALLWQVIREQEIERLFLPYVVLEQLALRAEAPYGPLRDVISAGEALTLSPAIRSFIGRLEDGRLHNHYGPTESHVVSNHLLPAAVSDWPLVAPIGVPLPNISLQVLDAHLQPCPIGIPGELHIGGASLARGYLNRPDLTSERFIPSPFCDDSTERLYKTGDLASWNADGTLAFHGRLDQQIKLRGFRIEPGEIEAALIAHPAVEQAVVLLREDQPANPQLVAYWVASHPSGDAEAGDSAFNDTAEASTFVASELRPFLADRLPGFMVPAAFVRLEVFPLTPNGKLDRSALPVPSFGVESSTLTTPRNLLERQLHGIWAEVLSHRDFGIHDNFFHLGGHSLAAARLASRIEQQLGVTLPVARIFEAQTIADLSGLLHRPATETSASPALLPAAIPSAEPLTIDGLQAYPASFSQARLWFLHQLEPDLTAYHMPALWQLSGPLDRNALQDAFSQLLARHQVLRSSFLLVGEQVLQIIHHPAPFHLALTLLPADASSADIDALLSDLNDVPFDLAQAPLLLAHLLQRAADDHLLLITVHHIASDGWSRSLLHRELAALYAAAHSGQPSPLAPLPLQYADFAAWQRQQLNGDRRQALLAYWSEQLRALPPLELPSDHPRPPVPSYRGECIDFQIAPEATAGLDGLCRQQGATLQMGLLALVAALLHRYSRQDDFALGVPHWGRNHPDLEPLIGFFVNALVVRSDLSGVPSFLELLSRLRSTSLAAYDHQELPFEQLVEALQPDRDRSRNPLVQVMVQLLDLPDQTLQLEGLKAESLASPVQRARLDLEFFFRHDAEQGLQAHLVYSTDLFSTDRITRLAGHLKWLLEGVLAQPAQPIGSLPLLTSAERHQLDRWSAGPALPLPERCVHELFEEQAARTPEATALVFADQELSYGALNAHANQLAHRLLARGVGPEVIVGVCLERSFEMVVALLAILKAAGAYLPLDPSLPEGRLQRMLADAEPLLVVVDGPTCTLAALASRPLLNLSDDLQEPDAGDPQPPEAILRTTPAYLLYTSGSTGIPKGVLVPHRTLAGLVAFHRQHERLWRPARTLQFASCGFDVSLQEVFSTLCLGGTLVLTTAEERLDPALLWQAIRAQEIERLFLPSVVLEQLALCAEAPYGRLRDIISAGEALILSPAIRGFISRLKDGRLHNHYGPMESHVVTHHLLPAAANDWPAVAPIGVPLPNIAVHVLDPQRQPCPVGVPGELHVGGAGLALGYLNRPDLTAERFIADPFSADPGARLYKSGDLASWNPDGTLAFHGRLDQQIKLRGYRIEPGEIEANLLAHSAVAQAVVLLRQDDPANPRLIAYWTPDTSENAVTADELRDFLSQLLPDYMLPAAFVRLEVFPLTPNGKLDRSALPAPCFAGDLHRRIAASTPLQQQLHSLWADVLGHGDFGIHDNFFAIGGHSLAAARLIFRIEESLATTMPLAMIFHAPTIAEMVLRLQGQEALPSDVDPCLVPLQALGEAIPLFVIHGFGGDVFCYTDFAGFLAPNRPVYGLQARGIDGHAPRHRSVEEMAEHYATLIEECWPQGPYHLLGQSAGGWYAYAVAAALLRRGGSIGMLAILDTDRTAFISGRLRTSLLLRKTILRLPDYLEQLRHSKRPRNVVKFLRHHSRNLSAELQRFRPPPAPSQQQPHDHDVASGHDYYDLLHSRYQPTPLPVTVHLFTTSRGERLKCRLWRAHACGGVRHRRLFEEHYHYHLAPWAADLAAAIRDALEQQEAESG